MAGPPRGRGGLSHHVAAGGGPSRAASGPGLAGTHRGRGGAGVGRVAGRGPGAGVEQRGQVLRRPRGPRRQGRRGGRGEALVEILRDGLCRDRAGRRGGAGPQQGQGGAGRGRRGLCRDGAGLAVGGGLREAVWVPQGPQPVCAVRTWGTPGPTRHTEAGPGGPGAPRTNPPLTCRLERGCLEGGVLGVVRLQPRAARGSRGRRPQGHVVVAFLV